jgi:acyl-CoA synthetase (AMP-forming)/AMP-acid ligase II
VQRRDDIILTGGENVYPAEVESVLRQYPDVVQACVVGVASPEWGQQVAAMIVLRPASGAKPDDIDHFCRQRVAGYKIPRLVRFVEALPQTASGKIHRRAVVEMLENKVTL